MKGIRQKRVDLTRLKLSPEEGFVLSRVEGSTSVKELVALTGLDEARITEIVTRLSAEGALEVDSPSEPDKAVALRVEPQPVEANVAADSAPAVDDAERPETEDIEQTKEEAEHEAKNERDYRRVYEETYAAMGRDERVRAAAEASGSHLLALCLDPEPLVIHAVVTNQSLTLEGPRLIATHHRTHVGLEHIAKRSDFLADAMVQRRLLRNPQLPGTILNRMVNPKLMMDVYKIALDREIPERSRLMTREILRKKFMLASADERAALLFKTEGRCLIHLVNCSLDAHATQILCSKQSFSLMLIQNLARWSATPPMLLGHLLKLQVVRHNTGLRKMLLKHPNTPSELKRSL